MEIKLTDAQYKKILELLYLSDLFLGNSDGLLSEKEDYKQVLDYIYSYSENKDRAIRFQGLFGDSPLVEKDLDKIEDVFDAQLKKWIYGYLSEKFVEKEFPNTKILKKMSAETLLSTKQFISEEGKKYIKEFEENNLENIRFKFFKKPQKSDD